MIIVEFEGPSVARRLRVSVTNNVLFFKAEAVLTCQRQDPDPPMVCGNAHRPVILQYSEDLMGPGQ